MIKNFLENKKILITGASGSIGSELARQLILFKCKLILVDQDESSLYDLAQEFKGNCKNNFEIIIGDISNKQKTEHVIGSYRPNIIFHAAAYKHVPLMENHPDEAVRVNILGTKIVIDAAIKFNIEKLIFISTDKAVNPSSVMGATKRVAELYLQLKSKGIQTELSIVRFGNVLKSRGSIIPLFYKQLKAKQNITITHKDVTRYFISIQQVGKLIINTLLLFNQGATYLFEMGAPKKIIDLAKNMIVNEGLSYSKEIDITIIGLRSGEKLHEELLRTSETACLTSVKDVFYIKNSSEKKNIQLQDIENLCHNIYAKSNFEIVILLKEILPEFNSNNAEYQILNKK